MADEYITKKDLSSIIQQVRIVNESMVNSEELGAAIAKESDKQRKKRSDAGKKRGPRKVKIENPSDVSKDLIEAQKQNDLKKLEESIEQKSVWQDIGDSLKGIGNSLDNGFGSLGAALKEKGKSGLMKLLGLLGIGAGLLLAPFAAIGAFFTQLAVEVKFLDGLTGGRLSNVWTKIKSFFKLDWLFEKFGKIKESVTKFFKGGKGGFISKIFGTIGKVFSAITNSGAFKSIISVAKGFGRILGKIFFPVTLLMGIFDFVGGFMEGYKEDGIIGGIGKGLSSLFEGLFGFLVGIPKWVLTKLAELFGFDNLAQQIGPFFDSFLGIFTNAIEGLVDFIGGIFTGDGERMKNGINQILGGLWEFIAQWWETMKAAVMDFFPDSVGDFLSGIGDWIMGNDDEDSLTESIKQPLNNLETPRSSSGGAAINAPSVTNNNSAQTHNVVYQVQGQSSTAIDTLRFALD